MWRGVGQRPRNSENVSGSTHPYIRRILIPGPCPPSATMPTPSLHNSLIHPAASALRRPHRGAHCQSPNARGRRRGRGEKGRAGKPLEGGRNPLISLPSVKPESHRGLGRGSLQPQVLPKSGNVTEERFPGELETGGFRRQTTPVLGWGP